MATFCGLVGIKYTILFKISQLRPRPYLADSYDQLAYKSLIAIYPLISQSALSHSQPESHLGLEHKP